MYINTYWLGVMCVWLCVCFVHACHSMWMEIRKKIKVVHFCLSTMWISEMELSLSGLVATAKTYLCVYVYTYAYIHIFF